MKISAESVVGYLGPGCELSGGITFSGTFRVDGRVRGGFLTGRTLVVGHAASVEGRIEVDVISVQGRLSGQILARRRLEILPGGHVEGDVRLVGPCLHLEEGGTLDGSIDIVDTEAASPDAVEKAASEG